jgi:hypothetical protein
MTNKKILIILLAALFICSLVISCGDGNSKNSAEEKQTAEAESSESLAVWEYTYPEMDGGGADFVFFTPITGWSYYTDLVFEEPPGEVLEDAIYKRNRFIEDKFNINIKAAERDIGDIQNQLKKVITAGSDEYDASFCPAAFGGNIGALITQKMFYDLREIPTMDLDGEWWNQTINREASIGSGDKLYYAGCGINLFTLQAVSCVYFNQDMMSSLGLDLPYNPVREGKWTFDTFNRYMKSGANLNGADSWKWNKNGTAVYGLASYQDSATALLAGSNERLVSTGADGTPHLAIESERFINVLTKIQQMLQLSDGEFICANDISSGFYFEPMFKNNRALMILGELKSADGYKDMEAAFGIVPIPKYDEDQKDYYSHLIYPAPVLVIPASNPNPDFAGAVTDAMAYVSNAEVTPVYFDVSVSQKKLRNEDSIEMLQIIKNSGSFEIGMAYGWTNDFYFAIHLEVGSGSKFDIASQIEKHRDKINANIEKTMELFD